MLLTLSPPLFSSVARRKGERGGCPGLINEQEKYLSLISPFSKKKKKKVIMKNVDNSICVRNTE